MKKLLYPFLCLFILLTTFQLNAVEFTIEGEINLAILPLPIPEHEVNIYSEDGRYQQTLTTDNSGLFSTTFEVGSDTGIIFIIEIIDECTGDVLMEKVKSKAGSVFVRFLLCELDRFPCQAHFEYFPVEENWIQFLHFSTGQTTSWHWDFGDGDGSEEESPLHQYDSAGTYTVSLTVMGPDSCVDSMLREVIVGENPCFCPEYYLPVCAEDSLGQRDTFPNPCFAACAGYSYFVSCHDTCDCPDTVDPVCIWTIEGELTYKNVCEALCEGLDTAFICDTSCYCPEIYDPVCVVTDAGDTLEFTNDCFAICAGYPDFFHCRSDCVCEDIYDPVCIYLASGEVLTFPNGCEAECAGYFEYEKCDTTCQCDDLFDPVCVVTDFGEVIRFPNLCTAICEGYPQAQPCDSCICPLYFAPVCVVNQGGDTLQFDNPCLAECAGYDQFVDCERDCGCEGIVDPVCVVLDDGSVKKYPSACQAICEGFNVFYNCDMLCTCPDIYDPVCVIFPDGTSRIFDNACWASCAGFEDFESCHDVDPNNPDDEKNATGSRPLEIHTYPNPFHDNLTLQGTSDRHDEIIIELFDLFGKLVWSKDITAYGSFWNVYIEAHSFTSGTYVMRVQQGNQVWTRKLIKP